MFIWALTAMQSLSLQ